jgi:hypothetical protein
MLVIHTIVWSCHINKVKHCIVIEKEIFRKSRFSSVFGNAYLSLPFLPFKGVGNSVHSFPLHGGFPFTLIPLDDNNGSYFFW